jgi:hypothetical protein
MKNLVYLVFSLLAWNSLASAECVEIQSPPNLCKNMHDLSADLSCLQGDDFFCFNQDVQAVAAAMRVTAKSASSQVAAANPQGAADVSRIFNDIDKQLVKLAAAIKGGDAGSQSQALTQISADMDAGHTRYKKK